MTFLPREVGSFDTLNLEGIKTANAYMGTPNILPSHQSQGVTRLPTGGLRHLVSNDDRIYNIVKYTCCCGRESSPKQDHGLTIFNKSTALTTTGPMSF